MQYLTGEIKPILLQIHVNDVSHKDFSWFDASDQLVVSITVSILIKHRVNASNNPDMIACQHGVIQFSFYYVTNPAERALLSMHVAICKRVIVVC